MTSESPEERSDEGVSDTRAAIAASSEVLSDAKDLGTASGEERPASPEQRGDTHD